MDLTIVIPIHNRSSENLMRLLCSIHMQYGTHAQDVIVVDTSDSNVQQRAYRAICKNLANHVLLPRRDFWKAKSLNIGLNMSVTKFTMFIDADMLLHLNFLDTVRASMSADPFIMAICGYLPENATGPWDTLMELAQGGEISRRLSPGACQMARTDWFKKVGGYNEIFHGPDGVDDDMMVRARKDELDEIWIENPPMLLHQWHERSPLKGLDSDKFTADPEVIITRDWLSW